MMLANDVVIRSTRLWIWVGVALLAIPPTLPAEGFPPDPDQGWIRYWVVYGYLGEFPGRTLPEHPVTGEPLLLSDFISEAPGTDGRRTEANFLPAPYLEIDTEFGTVAPGHHLRVESRPGLNPNGKPMGIPWVNCDCTTWFDLVFLGTLPAWVTGDSSSTDDRERADAADGIAYAYTYVENTTGETIQAYPSVGFGTAAQILLRSLPDRELKPIFFHRTELAWDTDCADGAGPPLPPGEERPVYVVTEPIDIEPGLNLLLAKVFNGIDLGALRFRFRGADSPHEPITEGLRIRLAPDPDAPDPPLFRRMDVDGADGVNITDALRILFFLFLGTERTLPCPDAADVDDDGEIVPLDALLALTNLFLEPTSAELPAVPYACCGFDPTFDTLDRYAANNTDPAADAGARDPGRGSCVFAAEACR